MTVAYSEHRALRTIHNVARAVAGRGGAARGVLRTMGVPARSYSTSVVPNNAICTNHAGPVNRPHEHSSETWSLCLQVNCAVFEFNRLL